MRHCEKITIPMYNQCDLKQKKKKYVTGWEEVVREKQAYQEYREVHIKWIKDGRKKQGEIFESRKEKLRIYKGAVRYCKKNEKEFKVKKC